MLLLAALLLIALSVFALVNSSSGGSQPAASAASTASRSSTAPPPAATTSPSQSPSSRSSSTTEATSSAAAPLVNCTSKQLKIAAASDAKSYPVNSTPVLSLIVTDLGPRPCITDLADKQIELRVYAGSARVWGSHDCEVQPGTSKVTLPVGKPIRREIQWSGLSSQPACAGIRQRVPPGTYTVLAFLAGRQGTAATFTMAG
ncbi:MAG: hypothetical protein JWO63_144 [Frankiales bacterium]|jgi:hypothetical protein|nr:hypothetical protein [Frankiales bacterium]